MTTGEVSSSVGLEINKNAKFEVDDSAPKTRINIRLHNGESLVQEFNLTHTLNDIRVFVGTVAPVNGTYDLVEGFPPKPLDGDLKTIKELNIQGSTLIQRLT
jgi:UBX domain-containing protein 1